MKKALPRRRTGRILATLSSVAVGLLALSACSSTSETPSTPDPTTSGASDQTFQLKYASIVPAALSSGQTLQWWAEEVSARTDGRVTVEIFPSESLVSAFEVLPAVKDGRADLGLTSSQYYPAELSAWGVAGVPFVTTNAEATARAFTKLTQDNALLQSQFDAQGVRPLFFVPLGSATFGTRDPISSTTEMSGLKLRAAGLISQALTARGIEPVALQPAEMYESIERGVIDGWAGFGLDSLPGFGLSEVAPNILDIGLGQFASTATIISIDQWNEFPEDIQAILTELADDTLNHSLTVIAAAEEAACQTIKESGATVGALPATEVQAWQSEVAGPIAETFVDSVVKTGADAAEAQELLEDYRAAVAEFEAAATYQDGLAVCASS